MRIGLTRAQWLCVWEGVGEATFASGVSIKCAGTNSIGNDTVIDFVFGRALNVNVCVMEEIEYFEFCRGLIGVGW